MKRIEHFSYKFYTCTNPFIHLLGSSLIQWMIVRINGREEPKQDFNQPQPGHEIDLKQLHKPELRTSSETVSKTLFVELVDQPVDRLPKLIDDLVPIGQPFPVCTVADSYYIQPDDHLIEPVDRFFVVQ